MRRASLILALALAATPARAQPPVRVLMSGGLRAVFEAVKPQAERALGRPIVVQYAASRALQDVIETGQPFEVAVATPEVIAAEAARGRIRPGARRDVAAAPIGVAQRGGKPRDISNTGAFKLALVEAKAVRFASNAALPAIDKAFADLNIVEAMKAKANPGPPGAPLAPGEYELTLNLASELLALPPGTTYLGPFPAPVQVPAIMSAGVGAAGDPDAARRLVDFLTGPAVGAVLKANRMTR
jgi:molybdate transport system substrate-binding protein